MLPRLRHVCDACVRWCALLPAEALVLLDRLLAQDSGCASAQALCDTVLEVRNCAAALCSGRSCLLGPACSAALPTGRAGLSDVLVTRCLA